MGVVFKSLPLIFAFCIKTLFFKTALALPSGPCAPGYYCTGEAATSKPIDGISGDVCPPGFYCGKSSLVSLIHTFNIEHTMHTTCVYCMCYPGEGAREPEPCPTGTFSSEPGLQSRFQCQICTAGHYCSSRGLKAPTAPCSEGKYEGAYLTDVIFNLITPGIIHQSNV